VGERRRQRRLRDRQVRFSGFITQVDDRNEPDVVLPTGQLCLTPIGWRVTLSGVWHTVSGRSAAKRTVERHLKSKKKYR